MGICELSYWTNHFFFVLSVGYSHTRTGKLGNKDSCELVVGNI